LYGDGSQLVAQIIGTATCFIFVYAAMWAWFKISNKITPIRVKAEDEIGGLDMPEMGALGYVD
jgi:ammonium transporter, Amt family